MMSFVSFQHAGSSDIGERKRQEDAYGIKVFQHAPQGTATGHAKPRAMELIAVLADGMGGHAGGAKASQISCDCFMANYPEIGGTTHKRLLLSLDASNKALAATVEKDDGLKGMGCTLLGVFVDASGVSWVSVGDSLLYLYHNQKLERLNEDHSLAPVLDALVKRGEMAPNAARHHPKRNMLRSAVTGGEIKLVDLNSNVVPLARGDWILLASDGLATLSEEQIAHIIEQNATQNADLIVRSILKAVKKKAAPQQDNITVLAIGFDEARA